MGNKKRALIASLLACAFIFGVLVLGVRNREHQSAASNSSDRSFLSSLSSGIAHPDAGRTQQQKAEHTELQAQGSSPTSAASPQAHGAEASGALPSVASAVVPQPTCYYESFRHKPTPGHTDEEACSRHKNLLQLAHSNVSPAHLCVRVNGIPVKFERKGSGEILIGSIAGPKAKITVNYCLGKSSCEELAKVDCTIPKDEFMEALGGDSDSAAQWGENTKLNADVKKELEDIDEVNHDNDRAPAQAGIFKDWIREQDASACGQKQPS